MTYPPQKQPLRPVPTSNAHIARAYADIPEAMVHLRKIRRWLMRCWESVRAGKKKLEDRRAGRFYYKLRGTA